MNQSPHQSDSIELDKEDCLELMILLRTYGQNNGKDWDLWASQINQTIQSFLNNSPTTSKVLIKLAEPNLNAINSIVQSSSKELEGEWSQRSQRIGQVINDACQKTQPPLPFRPSPSGDNHSIPKCLSCGRITPWKVEPLFLPMHFFIAAALLAAFGSGFIYIILVGIMRANPANRSKICPYCGAKNMWAFVYNSEGN